MKKTYWIAGLVAAGLAVAGIAHANQGGMGRISFEQLDTDGDGKLTKAEMVARKGAQFAKADVNGDGMLSADEMMTQGRGRMQHRVARMIEMRDANGDGMLSMEEMPGNHSGDRLFMRVDANGDGAVTAEEFNAAKAKWRMHRGGKPASE